MAAVRQVAIHPGLWFEVNGLRSAPEIEYHLNDVRQIALAFDSRGNNTRGICCGDTSRVFFFLTSCECVCVLFRGTQASVKSSILKYRQPTVAKWQPWKLLGNTEGLVSLETPFFSRQLPLNRRLPQLSLNALGGGTLCPGKRGVAMESLRRMLDRHVQSSGPWPAAGGLHQYRTMFLGCLKLPYLTLGMQADYHCSWLKRSCALWNDRVGFKMVS